MGASAPSKAGRGRRHGGPTVEMKMTNDPDDRFGVPTERLLDAIRTHEGVIRCGCYIPTRREVAEASADRLWSILLDWWWESPSELIPTWYGLG